MNYFPQDTRSQQKKVQRDDMQFPSSLPQTAYNPVGVFQQPNYDRNMFSQNSNDFIKPQNYQNDRIVQASMFNQMQHHDSFLNNQLNTFQQDLVGESFNQTRQKRSEQGFQIFQRDFASQITPHKDYHQETNERMGFFDFKPQDTRFINQKPLEQPNQELRGNRMVGMPHNVIN